MIKSIKKIAKYSYLINDCIILTICKDGTVTAKYDISINKETVNLIIDEFLSVGENDDN